MLRNHLRTYVSEAPSPLLGTFSRIVTHDSHKKNVSIPNLGRGPPGRGPRPTHRLRTTALYHSVSLAIKIFYLDFLNSVTLKYCILYMHYVVGFRHLFCGNLFIISCSIANRLFLE